MTDPQQSTFDSHANTLMSFKAFSSERIVVCRRFDYKRLSSRYAAFENKQVLKKTKEMMLFNQVIQC